MVGVQKKKMMKRRSKKRLFIKKFIDYLKSDTYMFSPLISSTKIGSTSDPGVDTEKHYKENGKKLLEKIGDYLKSDFYMYAPLVESSHSVDIKAVNPPRKVPHLQRVSNPTTSMRKIIKKPNQPIEQTGSVIEEDPFDGSPLEKGNVVKQTITHRETVKHMVHQLCRSTSKQAKGILEKERRKVLID